MKINLVKDRLTDTYVEIMTPPTRLPLGRGNQASVADTIRKVTGGKALEVAAFNSFAD